MEQRRFRQGTERVLVPVQVLPVHRNSIPVVAIPEGFPHRAASKDAVLPL